MEVVNHHLKKLESRTNCLFDSRVSELTSLGYWGTAEEPQRDRPKGHQGVPLLLTFVANGATDGGRGLSTRARMRRKDYESEVGGPV